MAGSEKLLCVRGCLENVFPFYLIQTEVASSLLLVLSRRCGRKDSSSFSAPVKLSWGGLPLQCPLRVELGLHGVSQRQPTFHCPSFSPSAELELLHCWRGTLIKVVSGRHLPAAPGVLSWTQETFLMGVFFKWAPPSKQLLYQWTVVVKKKAQMYFTEGKNISPLLQHVHFAYEDWGLQGHCLVWVSAHGQRSVIDGWTTWLTRSLPTSQMILWSSGDHPVTILKCLLSFLFYSTWIESSETTENNFQMFQHPLLTVLPTDLVLLLLLIFKVSGGKIINPCFIYRIPIMLNRLFLHKNLHVECIFFELWDTFALKRGFHMHYRYIIIILIPLQIQPFRASLSEQRSVEFILVFFLLLKHYSKHCFIVSNPVIWQRENYNVLICQLIRKHLWGQCHSYLDHLVRPDILVSLP